MSLNTHDKEFQAALLKVESVRSGFDRIRDKLLFWRVVAVIGWLTLAAIFIREFSK